MPGHSCYNPDLETTAATPSCLHYADRPSRCGITCTRDAEGLHLRVPPVRSIRLLPRGMLIAAALLFAVPSFVTISLLNSPPAEWSAIAANWLLYGFILLAILYRIRERLTQWT